MEVQDLNLISPIWPNLGHVLIVESVSDWEMECSDGLSLAHNSPPPNPEIESASSWTENGVGVDSPNGNLGIVIKGVE